MSQQAPSRIKVPQKKKKEGFGPWAETKITLDSKDKEVKEKENSLLPRMIPLIHPAKIIDLVENKSKDIG